MGGLIFRERMHGTGQGDMKALTEEKGRERRRTRR
jgi:hypothetical protein